MAAYWFPSAGRIGGKPYTAIAEGIGATVVIVACTVARLVADAVMVVVPGVYVDWKFAVV